MSFRIMFDSVDPAAIPADAELVGGYVDGPASQWPSASWTMFPKAQFVRINVTGDPGHGGDALDVERFDATPDHAPVWFDERTKAGAAGLTIYCNRDTLPAVEAAMGKRSYFRWIATLDGTLAINGYKPLEGPAAVQFAGAKLVGGRNVDVSLVMSDYFHPAPVRIFGSVAELRAKALTSQAEAGQLLSLLDRYGA
jgi:hypothetical protein